jgi:hypothetical protein
MKEIEYNEIERKIKTASVFLSATKCRANNNMEVLKV